jgi:hypothetical protein
LLFRISRTKDFSRQKIIVGDLLFIWAVLMVQLRQDESLDSPTSLESAKAGLMMPLNPFIGQANACFAITAPLK